MSSAEPSYPSSGRAWWSVLVFLALYVLSFVDRQVLSLMIVPIQKDLGIGDFQASLLSGFAFALFYTFFGIPIARLADSRSRRAIVAAGLAIWSGATACCGIARGYASLFLARTGVGVGEAALSPSAYSSIADAFPPEKRGRAMGVYSVGSYLGSGLAFLLGGYLIAYLGERTARELPLVGTLAPWRVVFLAVGIPGLVLVPLLATVVEPSRRGAHSEGRRFAETLAHLRAHWKAYAGHNVGFGLLALSGYGSSAWTPAFLQRVHGMSVAGSGIALGWILGVAGTLGIVFGGWLSDRMLARGKPDATMRVGLIAALVWIPAGVLYPLVADRTLALALMVPALFTSGMPWGAAAAAVHEMTPGSMRAQATAVYLFSINLIGLGAGPSAVAYATEYVYREPTAVGCSLAWVTLAAHLVAAILLFAALRPFARAKDASTRIKDSSRLFRSASR